MSKKISLTILVVLLIGVLTLNVFAVSTSKEKGGIYAGVEPLETPTTLTFASLGGSYFGFPTWLIEQFGGYKQGGITPNYALFSNGPVMVESLASDSWDCGSYGAGGAITGVIGHDALILAAAAPDGDSIQFFAYPDDPIVKAGNNIPEFPTLYGTKETWKGRDIYLPLGTPAHYVLQVALSKFGLTDKDVKLTHMDPATGNSYLRAGGEDKIVCLWATLSYADDLDERFVRVIKSRDIGILGMITHTANPRSYANPVKREAIKKWMELYFLTADWILNNIDEAGEYYQKWNDSIGVKTTVEECKALIMNNMYYTLKENYEMATTYVEEDGKKMSDLQATNYRTLKFFVSKGNYEPQSLEKFGDEKYFNFEIIKELYDAKNKE